MTFATQLLILLGLAAIALNWFHWGGDVSENSTSFPQAGWRRLAFKAGRAATIISGLLVLIRFLPPEAFLLIFFVFEIASSLYSISARRALRRGNDG